MRKIYTALGLMSGTSMDGVDASIIQTDGETNYNAISNKYFEYKGDLYKELISLRDKIKTSEDLTKFENELKSLEKNITLFHAKAVNNLIDDTNIDIDFVGFHGQTIFHNAAEKISVQLGDGKLLSQLTKKKIVYDFRQNDLKNGGRGAPLTPIFHNHMVRKIYPSYEDWPLLILNIGGISNVTSASRFSFITRSLSGDKDKNLYAADIGPGNCMIDEWIRKNSKYEYDEGGSIAKSGKVNELILKQALSNFFSKDYFDQDHYQIKSLDIKNFDISFVRGLSLEDGAATLTHFTAKLIGEGLIHFMLKNYSTELTTLSKAICLVCGGGRKNKYLIDILKKKLNIEKLVSIDEYSHEGDFIESQAFGYLSIRSYLGLPISFPETTGCKEPITGGVIVKNY